MFALGCSAAFAFAFGLLAPKSSDPLASIPAPLKKDVIALLLTQYRGDLAAATKIRERLEAGPQGDKDVAAQIARYRQREDHIRWRIGQLEQGKLGATVPQKPLDPRAKPLSPDQLDAEIVETLLPVSRQALAAATKSREVLEKEDPKGHAAEIARIKVQEEFFRRQVEQLEGGTFGPPQMPVVPTERPRTKPPIRD